MNIDLIRDLAERTKTFGKLFIDGKYLGETLEDTDRFLEDGGEKIDGQTAIPRGRYKVTVTYSNRFKKPMPYIHDVPDFDGVRIHGGNTEEDTHGCPLLGNVRSSTGIAQCAGVNERLMHMLEACEDRGEPVWLTVK